MRKTVFKRKRSAGYHSMAVIGGTLRGNRRGFAFLIRDDGGEDIFIPNKSLNGAVHGDRVNVELGTDGEGRVTSVKERGIKTLTGTYIRSGAAGYVVPDDDSYFKYVYIMDAKHKRPRNNDKVLAEIIPSHTKNRICGRIKEVLGKSGERAAEVLSILKNYGFSDRFPENVLRETENIAYKEESGRKDFRELLTITIDGADAKDFDDAVSLDFSEGKFTLYVHIADVSHYVKTGSAADKEAFNRGTSVYFPGAVYPMFPENISNGVCSLNPEEDKLTVSVIMEFDAAGELRAYRFYNSVIRSKYRMTYDITSKILDGDKNLCKKYAELVPMLNNAARLSEILSKKRKRAGSIGFSSKEALIELNQDGSVKNVSAYPYGESNGIIEQFMIAANETVAKFLAEKGLPAVYRIHEPPNEVKLQEFREFINALGYDIDLRSGVTPSAFAELLDRIKGEPSEIIVNDVMLRTMQKAKYSPENTGHFGLSLEYYCHFTSPIRRYPDLMVHRVLKAIISRKINAEFLLEYKARCESASLQSSERELSAERAERDIDNYYKAAYMENKIGESYRGKISGVMPSGVFVMLDNTVEGFIPVSLLPEDDYTLDRKLFKLKGFSGSYSIGEDICVTVEAANAAARTVTFAASPPNDKKSF